MKIFIDVGPAKTGTTFLQTLIYPKIKNVNFIRYFDFRSKLYEDKINIICAEAFGGHFSLRVGEDKYKDENFCDRKEIATRLHNMFPEAKILVGIREIEQWIKSGYKQYIRTGGYLDFDEWHNQILNPDYLYHDEYLDHLFDIFDYVYVRDFELLKKDHKKFVKGICDFIGCEVPEYKSKNVYPAWSDRQLKISKFFNKYMKSKFNKHGIIKRKRIESFLSLFSRTLKQGEKRNVG